MHPDLPPYTGDRNNGFANKPYKTGKHLPDSPHGHRAGIQEAVSAKCSGTLVTVCTFCSQYIIYVIIMKPVFCACASIVHIKGN